MRILVIGGTRFIGPPVALRLHEQGHTLRLFHRHPPDFPFPAAIEHVLGDRRADWDAHAEALRAFAPEVVLDMIPLTEYDAVQVVETFRGVAQRVVAISSQDVYRAYGRVNGSEPGDPDPVPLAEDAPLRERLYPYRTSTPRAPDNPRRILDDYDKILVERVVMGAPELAGTALRLPMVYGPRDYQRRLFPYLKRMDDGRPAILMDRMTARWWWTREYVENAAVAIALAVTDDRAAGRIYNVGDMPALNTEQWVTIIGEVAGWEGEVITAADYQLPEDMRAHAGMEQDLVADSSRIRDELGYKPPVPLREGLRQTIAWDRANPVTEYDPAQFDYATEDSILAIIWQQRR
jgi:nucleoside-diphosphate-sugar epimerase